MMEWLSFKKRKADFSEGNKRRKERESAARLDTISDDSCIQVLCFTWRIEQQQLITADLLTVKTARALCKLQPHHPLSCGEIF